MAFNFNISQEGSDIREEASKMDLVESFLETLRDFEYGWVDRRGRVHKDVGSDEFVREYRLQHPDTMRKTKTGVCWDFVEYERDWFHEHGIHCVSLWVSTTSPERASHTVLAFTDDSKHYYIEAADQRNQGIHGPFESFQLLADTVVEGLVKRWDFEYGVEMLRQYPKPEYHMSVDDFYDHIQNRGIPMRGRRYSEP